jgi:uncharacterized protein YpmB
MVILVLIVALIGAGTLAYSSFRVRFHRERAEDFEERYFGMASDNVDLRVKLQDAQEAYSRLIGQRAMGWAGEELRVH